MRFLPKNRILWSSGGKADLAVNGKGRRGSTGAEGFLLSN